MNNNDTVNIPLFFEGSSKIRTDSIILSNVSVGTELSDAHIDVNTMTISAPLNVAISNTSFHFEVQQQLNINSSISMNGKVHFWGPNLYLKGNITINGELEATSNLFIDHSHISVSNFTLYTSGYNTLNISNSRINSNLNFSQYSMNYLNSTFYGNIINNGDIQVTSTLNINGNYEQTPGGVLALYNIDLFNSYSCIFANIAMLNGTIKYSKSPSKIELKDIIILSTWNHLFGTFSKSFDLGGFQEHMQIAYTPTEVRLEEVPEHNSNSDLTTWLILGAIVLPVVIGSIALGGCQWWRRRGYSKLAITKKPQAGVINK